MPREKGNLEEKKLLAKQLLAKAKNQGYIDLFELDEAFSSSDKVRIELQKTLMKNNIEIRTTFGDSIFEEPIIDTSLDTDVIEDFELKEEKEEEPVTPPKRKRGRPRKSESEKKQSKNDYFDDDEDEEDKRFDNQNFVFEEENDDEEEDKEDLIDLEAKEEEEEERRLIEMDEDDSSYYEIEDDLDFEDDNFEDFLNIRTSSKQKITDENSVRMYLKEIGQIPLLSVEREREIAKTIYDAKVKEDEFNEKTANGYVPTAEETDEINRIRFEGDQAKMILTESNLRLVIHIAKNFNTTSMDFADLIQEGSSGLMKAVEKFDYTRGNKFSTYATGWIKQAITRAIADQARTIRIPVHMNETINKLNKKERELTQSLGRRPTIEELAEAMDIKPDKISMIKRVSQKTKSLEDTVGEEEDSTYGDFIPDLDNPNPEEYTMNEALKAELDNLLGNLSDREERVIKLRFGLIDGRTRTLEEVGREYGITRERIRQIEAKALRKLRHPSKSNKLKDFIKQ